MSFTAKAKPLRPEGEYECLLHNCHVTETVNGTPVIEFDFMIRRDIDQPFQGQHIFKRFFADDQLAWPEEKIGRYANSLGIEDGADFELCDLIGRCCVVVTKHIDKSDGTKGECIFFLKPSSAEPTKSIDSEEFGDVSMDDCPFN